MGKTTLLLIDLQKDFHAGGPLAIPNADEDAERIANFINANANQIDRIVATLDSHKKLHIAHAAFWVSNKDDGSAPHHPEPYTVITLRDLEEGLWIPRPDIRVPSNEFDSAVFENSHVVTDENGDLNLRKYCIEYARQLEQRGKFPLCIWPENTLIGSRGHALVDVVRDAISEWSYRTGGNVEFIYKGNNLLTEMFSAFSAVVPVNQETTLNTMMIKDLDHQPASGNRLIVAGQALSHCLNYTLRDIVENWPKEKRSEISLMEDCSSIILGHEKDAQQLIADMSEAGVQVIKSTDITSRNIVIMHSLRNAHKYEKEYALEEEEEHFAKSGNMLVAIRQ